jgi:signal transduction histidine kinase
MRLTLLYSGLFLTAGAMLVALIYLLVARWRFLGGLAVPPVRLPPTLGDLPAPRPPTTAPAIQGQLADQRAQDLRQLLASSLLALAAMASVSVAFGWLMAGRVLRPLGTMTATVRRISADRLEARLAATGPDDELKELADTFDGLLGRLESAFAAQRRFVANSSHELRTPLTRQRAMIEVALVNPRADAASMRATLRRLLAACEQQERLIDALLALARGQQGIARRQPIDLAAVARLVIGRREQGDVGAGVRVESTLDPAPMSGDVELVERLVANLLDNALRHNVPRGWAAVSTTTESGRPMLRIANSGPVIEPDQVELLPRPFRRLETGRAAKPDGFGLGLSIVAAVADAHTGTMRLRPLTGGGLEVSVEFSPASPPRGRTRPAMATAGFPTIGR